MKFKNTLQYCSFSGPLGPMTLAAHGDALAGIWFDGQQHQPVSAPWTATRSHPALRQTALQLQEYFAGKRTTFDLLLDLSGGTVFQQQVWRALLDIPSGSTVSYGAISQRIGKPSAVRAVGAAVGRNPLSIVVPCHRVVGANGALTGYAGGLERKIALLQLESTH
ncbi:MAG: methylated-DNA--[protein]-cysteine S-methyltransferase [Burkholderiales bacterium]|nr:methylated-DNA--[protein]-cysteine S-methyltransferase [Burkholderiales bacterium]